MAAYNEEEDIIISIDNVSATLGETVVIPVRLTNNPGISYAACRFGVFQNGEAVDTEECGVSIVGSFADVATYNSENGTTYALEDGLLIGLNSAIRLFGNEFLFGSRSTDLITGDGILFYIVVAITETAQVGDYEIALSKYGTNYYIRDRLSTPNVNYEPTIVNGTLTVTDGDTPVEPDPVDSPYTVSLAPSKEAVALGEPVDVDVVVSGADFSAYDVTVTYDPTLFTYEGDTTGSVTITDYGKSFADGATVSTLTFTAVDSLEQTATGAFGISTAKIAVSGVALQPKDAYPAATEGASVDILLKYAVTFRDQDGGEIKTVTVTDGERVAAADIPTAPSLEHYTFNGWKDADGNVRSAEDILALPVTAPVAYTAVYTVDTFAVTFDPAEIDAAGTAAYGADYAGTVVGYDSNYAYTVTAAFAGGDSKDYPVGEDGSFTIPGTDVTGDMTLTVTKAIQNVSVQVYEDYVGGYSLVVVYGTADGYRYDGNAMYRTAYYDADTADAADKAFAYLIEGTTTENEVLKVLAAADSAEEITASYNVNASANVDIADVQAVADCYNVVGDLTEVMPVYLRADVNADHVVNSTDADRVLVNRT